MKLKKRKFQIGGQAKRELGSFETMDLTSDAGTFTKEKEVIPRKAVFDPNKQDNNLWVGQGNRSGYLKFASEVFKNTKMMDQNVYKDESDFYLKDFQHRLSKRHDIPQGTVEAVLNTTPLGNRKLKPGVMGRYYPGTGGIALSSEYHSPTTLAHELSHSMDFRLDLSKNKADLNDLRTAYLRIPSDAERRAVNTELRYQLYKNSGRKTRTDLDNYINSLDINSLKNAVKSLGNGYISEEDINGANIDRIKHTLINVAQAPGSSSIVRAKNGRKV